jgi:hypothetical protein
MPGRPPGPLPYGPTLAPEGIYLVTKDVVSIWRAELTASAPMVIIPLTMTVMIQSSSVSPFFIVRLVYHVFIISQLSES